MQQDNIDHHFLDRRLEEIIAGLKEGIRREVIRLREAGMPIYVDDNGRVVDIQTNPHPQP